MTSPQPIQSTRVYLLSDPTAYGMPLFGPMEGWPLYRVTAETNHYGRWLFTAAEVGGVREDGSFHEFDPAITGMFVKDDCLNIATDDYIHHCGGEGLFAYTRLLRTIYELDCELKGKAPEKWAWFDAPPFRSDETEVADGKAEPS